ncbi:hypothetical protein AX16_010312 [Volvariella volvacea WC 439]|nr:hypothetical protein AX16_010312 [Volvariella volvacea WC 439]
MLYSQASPGKTSKRKRASISVAKKKQTTAGIRPQHPRSRSSCLYVGNLVSSITDDRLRQLFSPFGTVKVVTIRCSRGCAENSSAERYPRHATVEFREPDAAERALKIHGIVLDNKIIVVSLSPADLPEVEDLARLHSLSPGDNSSGDILFTAPPGLS